MLQIENLLRKSWRKMKPSSCSSVRVCLVLSYSSFFVEQPLGGQAGRLHRRVGLHEEGEQGVLRLVHLPPVQLVEILVVRRPQPAEPGEDKYKLNGPSANSLGKFLSIFSSKVSLSSIVFLFVTGSASSAASSSSDSLTFPGSSSMSVTSTMSLISSSLFWKERHIGQRPDTRNTRGTRGTRRRARSGRRTEAYSSSTGAGRRHQLIGRHTCFIPASGSANRIVYNSAGNGFDYINGFKRTRDIRGRISIRVWPFAC